MNTHLTSEQQIRKLKINAPWYNPAQSFGDGLIESGSAIFAGQTIDMDMSSNVTRRVTFGVNVIVHNRVAITSEVLTKW
jgi:hypothetical protein|tara:strand:- start:1089 stop:1325 length:237 start_codon:yes stop_codon:yes gene_type:complete